MKKTVRVKNYAYAYFITIGATIALAVVILLFNNKSPSLLEGAVLEISDSAGGPVEFIHTCRAENENSNIIGVEVLAKSDQEIISASMNIQNITTGVSADQDNLQVESLGENHQWKIDNKQSTTKVFGSGKTDQKNDFLVTAKLKTSSQEIQIFSHRFSCGQWKAEKERTTAMTQH